MENRDLVHHLVRVLRADSVSNVVSNASTAGSAFRVSRTEVITCAHVVETALGLDTGTVGARPEQLIPFVPCGKNREGDVRWCRVKRWVPVRTSDAIGDIAVLEITEEAGADDRWHPSDIELHLSADCSEHDFLVFGFPVSVNNDAIPAKGKFDLPRGGSGWFQIRAESVVGKFTDSGFSGAAVLDCFTNGVVGIVVSANDADRTGAVIPVEHLWKTHPSLSVHTPAPRTVAQQPSVRAGKKALLGDAGSQLLDLTSVLDAEADLNPEIMLAHEKRYLEALESFIQGELTKSRDKGFVELSMRLADPASLSGGGTGNVRFGLLQPGDHVAQNVIQDLRQLDAVLQRERSLVLLGTPGSGKTTVLQHLALRLIGEYRRGVRSSQLPLFVPLTRYSTDPATGELPPIESFLKDAIGLLGVRDDNLVASRFRDLARAGRFVFLLDGLDQMPRRRSATARLDRLRRVENRMRRLDFLVKAMRLAGRQAYESMLIERQQEATRDIAPQIDERELQIDTLPDLFPCPVVVSCRVNDFIGYPDWQRVKVLPMDYKQVDEFVKLYAPGAREVVEVQRKSSEATRTLVSNPFYLRMLARLFEHKSADPAAGAPATTSDVIERRGQMLAMLITSAIQRELGGASGAGTGELTVDLVVRQLGELAYHMLESNLIAGVPEEAYSRWLGNDYEAILRIAGNVGLVEVRDGDPRSLEFNHQLFLETLLALHLRQRRIEKGGFEEALTLLSRQGDRWAETIKLLYEMVMDDPKQADWLLDNLIRALGQPQHWDIAKRVLSEIGRRALTRLVPLLQDDEPLTRRGVAEILGKIHATEYSLRLAGVSADSAWEVRRAAVEALIEMKKFEELSRFADDPSPAVLRAYYRGRLRNEAKPATLLSAALVQGAPAHQEQAAWASLDMFDDMCRQTPAEELAQVLESMLRHKVNAVLVLGCLASSRSPDAVRYLLKGTLLELALNATDDTVSYLASCAVARLLDEADLRRVQEMAELESPWKRCPASWLLAEVRHTGGLQIYARSLTNMRPAERGLLTRAMVQRRDSAGYAVLVHLLRDDVSRADALQGLCSVGSAGIAYLLVALDDPDPAVRNSVADVLKFVPLPRRLGRKVRANLRSRNETTHAMSWPGDVAVKQWSSKSGMGVAALRANTNLVSATASWAATRLFGMGFEWSAWWQYEWMTDHALVEALSDERVPPPVSKSIEEAAFLSAPVRPEAEYWLTRARLLRSSEDPELALLCLDRCLATSASHRVARYETAVILRGLGRRRDAREFLATDEARAIGTDEAFASLRELLDMELAGDMSSAGATDQARYQRLLVKASLWDDAFGAIRRSCQAGGQAPADVYAMLFQCYRGQNRTLRAVGAAVMHNRSAAEDARVPPVEIDNLRWRHRHVKMGQLFGEVAVLLDIGRFQEAVTLMRQQGALPSKDETLAPSRAFEMSQLLQQPEVKADALELLRAAGESELIGRLGLARVAA